MKITVFGATGETGTLLVAKLVEAGHDVTAFARTPAKINDHNGSVHIIEGDARDFTKVHEAIVGKDVVMAAFGPRSLKKDDIQTVFTQNVIKAMDQTNVKRLIELSAWGAGDDGTNKKLLFKIIRNTVLKQVFDDKNRAESLIMNSDLDYTLVRPGRLLNSPAKGSIKASVDGKGIAAAITREDVAAFMVDQIADTTWLRKCPIVGY